MRLMLYALFVGGRGTTVIMEPGAVLRPWVIRLPLKQQSALLSALRGPDHAFCHEVKRVVKFIRAASQHDADPSSDYMRVDARFAGEFVPGIDRKALERELEFCPLHFVAHLIEALVLVWHHAPPQDRKFADALLDWFAETFHLVPTQRCLSD